MGYDKGRSPERSPVKVLVTGGAGFIGSHVVDSYIDQGLDVVVVDDLSTGRRENVNPQAGFYEMDIRSPELAQLFEDERPQVVNHHAAHIDIVELMVDPLTDADLNIMGTVNVLQCCQGYGVRRLIYPSSGGTVYGEPEYLPCDEAHVLAPVSDYGASKVSAETYLRVFQATYGLETVVLRYANVYGPRQSSGEVGVVAVFTRQMLAGGDVYVHGDGMQERDFIYVSDCARANLAAVMEEGAQGVFNIGSGHGTSINTLVSTLRELTESHSRLLRGPERPADIRRIWLDASKAQRELGWEPLVGLEDGLRKTVEYQRAVREAVS